MGYVMTKDGFAETLRDLMRTYRVFAPVRKKGAGRFTDVDVVLYDEVRDASEIELEAKSDYASKEFLTPLSETLLYFTEQEVKEADLDPKPVLVFGRSCDLHAVKRLDQIYLANGTAKDPFYQRRRDLVRFVLIGCPHSFENCFCVDMGANRTTEGYVFSVDTAEGMIRADVPDPEMDAVFAAHGTPEEVTPAYVTENEVHVRIPENVPLSIIKDPLWDEYTTPPVASTADGAITYVPPAPAIPCRTFSTRTTERSASAEEWALPVWWTATPTWPAAASTGGPTASACASRCCTRSRTSKRDSAIRCA